MVPFLQWKCIEFVLKSHAEIVFKVCMTVITPRLNVVNAVHKKKKGNKISFIP